MQRPWARFWWVAFLATVVAWSASAGCNSAELKGPSGSGTASGGPVTPIDDGDSDGGLRDPIADLDGGVLPMSTGVTIQVLPSDSGAQVLAAISGARQSVHMTMYLLTNNDVIDALGDLKAAGRDVKVILNREFPSGGNSNTSAYNRLQTRGVPVAWAPSAYTFTHAKTIIIDAERILVMTMNLTQTSARDNREFVATDTDPDDVADAERLFDADFQNQAVSVQGKLVVSPQSASPIDARARLRALIDSAKSTLDVEIQSLSDNALTDAIILAHQDAVAVRVVLAVGNDLTPAQEEALAKLKAAGVPVRGLETPYIHAKAIVVDGERLFVGSHNFTPTALFQNREIGVMTSSPVEAAKMSAIIAADFEAGVPR